jgi:hypothetical protein
MKHLVQAAVLANKDKKLYVVKPKSGPLKGKLHIPQQSFTPGQELSDYFDDATVVLDELLRKMGYRRAETGLSPQNDPFSTEATYFLVNICNSSKDYGILHWNRTKQNDLDLYSSVVHMNQLPPGEDKNKTYEVVGWLTRGDLQKYGEDEISPEIKALLTSKISYERLA